MQVALLGCLVLGSPLASRTQDGAPWWNQPQGNAQGTSASTLEPLRSPPVEEWRAALGEIVAEPVVWSGIVYALACDGGELVLHALRVADGERLGSARLGRGSSAHLAVWNGTVLVVEHDQVRSFTSRKGVLKSAKRLEHDGLGPPCVHEGLLFVADGSELLCIDIERLKEIGRVPAGQGRPALVPGNGTARVATFAVRKPDEKARGELLYMDQALVSGIGGKSVQFDEGPTERHGAVSHSSEPRPGLIAFVAAPDQWFILSPRALMAEGGGSLPSFRAPRHPSSIATRPAIHDGVIYGCDTAGTLVAFLAQGSYREVVERALLPEGARTGSATIASGVLYLGNWAVDLESGRVLWCLPDLEPVTPLVPSDARRLVVGTRNELIGFGERRAPAGGSTPDASTSPSAPFPLGPVVVLSDGRVLAGPAERDTDGRLRAGGESWPPEAVAYADLADGARLAREEFPVFSAWRTRVRAAVQTALESLARSYADGRHLVEARRVLQEALEYGLPADRQRALEDALAGKQENRDANAPGKLAKKRELERERRLELLSGYHEAAAWCRERSLATAATVLLSQSRRILPEEGALDARRLCADLVPPAFPRDGDDVPGLWMEWAEQLLPTGASFLSRDDPAWARAGERWTRAVGLRSENLLLFSLERSPAVVGPCLRKGEGTLRALEPLLRASASVAEVDTPLEVRIHDSRQSYLLEDVEPPPWSAGCYSPADNVSRFYVPRQDDQSRIDRNLHYVLAHELTHHYLDRRWISSRARADDPGYWVDEGFARFVEDQALELGRSDRGFEDATVKSIDLMAQLGVRKQIIPLRELLDMSYADFAELDDVPLPPVQLRYTLATMQPTERGLFYDEAGSLVFFLMNRCGERGRAAFLEYKKQRYSGRAPAEGWKTLGWETPQALEDEFLAFLRTVSG